MFHSSLFLECRMGVYLNHSIVFWRGWLNSFFFVLRWRGRGRGGWKFDFGDGDGEGLVRLGYYLLSMYYS